MICSRCNSDFIPYVYMRKCYQLCTFCRAIRRKIREKAIRLVSYNIARGTLLKPFGNCLCGAPAVLWDHRDYRRPLEVQAICMKCNSTLPPAKW